MCEYNDAMEEKIGIIPSAVYTTEQVAELLNLDIVTIQRYVRSGELKAKKTGRKYLFLGQELLKYLRS